mmetsp:Transcript_45851/g.114004  ORF Transcript_45851/g.114004 Transcript_45851/m.114004 type:complete len:119 (-) Transcript_45851:274-630(-)
MNALEAVRTHVEARGVCCLMKKFIKLYVVRPCVSRWLRECLSLHVLCVTQVLPALTEPPSACPFSQCAVHHSLSAKMSLSHPCIHPSIHTRMYVCIFSSEKGGRNEPTAREREHQSAK